jgi:ethanolamine utilization protein EutN
VILCDVVGPVVATVKHPSYIGTKLLVVQPVSAEGDPLGPSLLAVDRVQAGPGELVLVMREGNGVRQLFGVEILPIRSIIVAIVDQVDLPRDAAFHSGDTLR